MDFMINGESIGTIKPSGGILQGDSMSPYLFIIVADVLSQMIKNASIFSYRSYKKCKDGNISSFYKIGMGF
nr:reverse transcriptase [Tanacetum cinerariifolium]